MNDHYELGTVVNLTFTYFTTIAPNTPASVAASALSPFTSILTSVSVLSLLALD